MYKKEFQQTGDGISSNLFSYIVLHPKYVVILIFIVAIFTTLALNLAFLSQKRTEPLTCGDGTFYGSCSLRKPYFCENGTLIERASVCNCNKNLERINDSCVSQYNTNPKSVALKYRLGGKQGEINFVVYEGMLNYIMNTSRAIIYEKNQKPLRADFKTKAVNEELQKEFLTPLTVAIQNKVKNEDDQLRIAVSVVQHIPYGFSNKKIVIANSELNYSRYPYDVLYDNAGICGEKSELLTFLLKEMGYDAVIFYFKEENHEAVGVKCPVENSYKNTGYCFIETSGPAVISDSSIEYANGMKLFSEPEIIRISYGKSIGDDWLEYKDAVFMERFRAGDFILFKNSKFNKIKEKYGLVEEYFID